MLSRLYPTLGSRNLLNLVTPNRFQVACFSYTPPTVPQYDSSKRDLVNFPRPKQLETNPEVRLGFIPKSWFDFFYPKTGASGGYMFMIGVSTFLLSKEYFVIVQETPTILTYVAIIYCFHRIYGQKLKNYLIENTQKDADELDAEQEQAKKNINEWLEASKTAVENTALLVKYIPEAKRENVHLQMEAAYRANLQEAYVTVKKHLDYHLEKQTIERRIAQKHMIDWIIKSVEQSITPQIKKNALQQCLGDLKALAARA